MKPARARAPRPQAGQRDPWWDALWLGVAWATMAAVELPSTGPCGRTAIPSAMRIAILVRERHRCIRCADHKYLEIHHKVAVLDGGPHSLANLVTLCAACHDEWTCFNGFDLGFDTWVGTPGSWWLVAFYARTRWPADKTAAELQDLIATSWLSFVVDRRWQEHP